MRRRWPRASSDSSQKLANPDGGALELQVVNYAVPVVDAKPLQSIEAPGGKAIEAKYDDIDPA